MNHSGSLSQAGPFGESNARKTVHAPLTDIIGRQRVKGHLRGIGAKVEEGRDREGLDVTRQWHAVKTAIVNPKEAPGVFGLSGRLARYGWRSS